MSGFVKVKRGTCSVCGAKDKVLYRRHPKECGKCYFNAKNEKKLEKIRQGTHKGVSQYSKKHLAELRVYRKKRDQYLKQHKICEVKGCGKPSTNIHHKAGRVGALLTDERYFMACCSTCHPFKIHGNPEWSEKMGYILRNVIQQKSPSPKKPD